MKKTEKKFSVLNKKHVALVLSGALLVPGMASIVSPTAVPYAITAEAASAKTGSGHLDFQIKGDVTKTVAPRDILFVVDRSGSMDGNPGINATNLIVDIMKGLTPDDRVAQISVRENASDAHPKLNFPFTSDIQTAINTTQEQDTFADSTTYQGKLANALSYTKRDGVDPTIIYVSDGWSSIGDDGIPSEITEWMASAGATQVIPILMPGKNEIKDNDDLTYWAYRYFKGQGYTPIHMPEFLATGSTELAQMALDKVTEETAEITYKPIDITVTTDAGIAITKATLKASTGETVNLPISGGKVQYNFTPTKDATYSVDYEYAGNPTKDSYVEGVAKVGGVEVARDRDVIEGELVETKTETKTEPIPYKTVTKTVDNLKKGEQRVAVKGVNGVTTITYEVTYTNGVESGRREVSRQVTTPAVEEVIEIGAGVSETKEVVEEEPIAFETEKKEVNTLKKGEEKKVQNGQAGVMAVIYRVNYFDGVETSREKVSETVKTAPVNEVIEVGTGIPSEDVKVDEQEIPFETERKPNVEMRDGEEKLVQAGVLGKLKITTVTPLTDGVPSGEPVVTEERILEPVTEIIEFGTGVEDEKEEVTYEEIPFQTVRVDDKTILKGQEVVAVEGVPGKMKVVTVTPLFNGEPDPTKEPVVTRTVETPETDKVINVGIGEMEPVKEVIKFNIASVPNPGLLEGETRVMQEGKDGEWTLWYFMGDILKREITIEPIDKIVEVGEGTPLTRTESIPYETVKKNNPTLLQGEQKIVQKGKNGVRTITYFEKDTSLAQYDKISNSSNTSNTSIPRPSDTEKGLDILSDEITEAPVEEIIEVGTMAPPTTSTTPKPVPPVTTVTTMPAPAPVQTQTPAPAPTQNQQQTQSQNVQVSGDNGKGTVKEAVNTGDTAARTNTIFGAMIAGMAGLVTAGITVLRRKRK